MDTVFVSCVTCLARPSYLPVGILASTDWVQVVHRNRHLKECNVCLMQAGSDSSIQCLGHGVWGV
jgi:hypothetical protein